MNWPVYIGGGFTTPQLHIASLSRAFLWFTLGIGQNADVNALAYAPDGGIYAGVDFTGYGVVQLWYVAHWKLDSWSPLGSGVNNPVYALASDGKHLFAGGIFTGAGGHPSCFFADWNTSALFLPVILKSP